MTRHRCASLVAAALLLAVAGPPARAVILGTCTVSAVGVSFGNYNPVATTALTSTGQVTVNCSTAFVFGTTAITIDLSTGASNTYTARTMLSGTNTLTYNLYQNAADTVIWGNGTGGSSAYDGNITGAQPTLQVTVYGQIPALQNPVPGSYTDTITVTVNY
jgi:spore coat protein U-like protein